MKDLTDRMVCFVNNLNLLGLKRIQENNDELGDNVLGCYSRANIQNPANDAFWGQWEIAGVVLDNQQFLTFDDTLSDEIRSALMTTFKSDILCCKNVGCACSRRIWKAWTRCELPNLLHWTGQHFEYHLS